MNLIRFGAVCCAVAAVCCSTGDLMAQRGGGMMRMMGVAELDSVLLVMKEVQEELKFTEEQTDSIVAKAREINDSLRSEMREIFGGGGDMSEVQAFVEDLRVKEKELIDKLDGEQKSRLAQLRYQRMGNAMYEDEKVQDAIGLSSEQRQTVADAFASAQDAISDARESGDFGSMREAMQDIQKELTDTIKSTLSDEQKEKAEELKGEPFEFPRPERRRRRGSDF